MPKASLRVMIAAPKKKTEKAVESVVPFWPPTK
jgi:hypothetical protein